FRYFGVVLCWVHGTAERFDFRAFLRVGHCCAGECGFDPAIGKVSRLDFRCSQPRRVRGQIVVVVEYSVVERAKRPLRRTQCAQQFISHGESPSKGGQNIKVPTMNCSPSRLSLMTTPLK